MKNHFYKTALILFVLASNQFLAQENKGYDWGKPEVYIPTESEKNLGEIEILNTTIKEFVIEKNNNYDFTIFHTKTYVDSDKAIERNNKVYVHFKSEGEEIITQKVRVIKPDGKVIELTKSDINEAEDQETKVKYKYFAVRGLEKKCVVEQLTIGKFLPKLNGKTVKMQNSVLQKNVKYELIYPNHLIFNIKSYNGLPEFATNDSIYKEKISSKLEVKEITLLNDEKYSNYDANVQKFSYKLSGNRYSNKFDLYNYKDYVTELLEFANQKIDAKENAALLKFIKQIPVVKEPKEQVKAIENFVKKNVGYSEHAETNALITTTLANKFANAYGLIRLYKNIFNYFKIKSEIVITANRYETNIDSKFESYNNLDQFVLFIPDLNGYVSPSVVETRFPILPFRWTNANAVFTKMTDFGGTNVPDYEIKKIETPGVDFTHDEMNVTVDFSTSSIKPNITSEITFNGYSAMGIQPIYDFIEKDKVEEFEKGIAENYCNKKENITITSSGTGTEQVGNPYVFKTVYTGENLIEKVGDKILFKVGEVIGKQAELYKEEARQMPIELQYPHSYKRIIKISLPKGYKVNNADKINASFVTNDNNTEICKFTTSYDLNANELIIDNVEFYKQVEMSKDLYDSYIKVLNAAADFNKLVLVLQKS